MKKGKKAISPVISTVLLVMIVILLAIIILVWSRGFIKEIISKEIGGNTKRVEEFCNEVSMTSILNEDASVKSFGFTNNGNVPIYALNLKLTTGGSSELIRIEPDEGGLVNPGFATLIKMPGTSDYYDYGNYDEVKIIPVLLGKTKTGGIKEKACEEIHALQI